MTLTADSTTSKPSSNKWVWVKSKGGLGNRMLCAATGFAYGLLTGRRVFVDWTDEAYSNAGENAFPRYFDYPQADSELEAISGCSIRPAVWIDHMDRSVSDMVHTYDHAQNKGYRIQKKYSIDPGELDYDEDVVVIWAYSHQIPALKRHLHRLPGTPWPTSIDGILARLIKEYMPLVPAVSERIEEFHGNHFRGPTIGVHVRYTDRNANVDRYVRAVARTAAQNPEASVFVATDNRSVLERFQAKFPRVISTEKWYPEVGQVMHQSKVCPDRYENGVEALLDMYLLARCDWLYYPRGSTFSHISSFLSNARPERIVDMERFNLRVQAARLARALLS